MGRAKGFWIVLCGLAVLGLSRPGSAQERTNVSPGTPVPNTVLPARGEPPKVPIALHGRHGHATPNRCGCTHMGAGNMDVQQPSPDTVIVTMTGVAVATGYPCGHSVAAFNFELQQC